MKGPLCVHEALEEQDLVFQLPFWHPEESDAVVCFTLNLHGVFQLFLSKDGGTLQGCHSLLCASCVQRGDGCGMEEGHTDRDLHPHH